ncbi:hypothetical protein QA640_25140 [Bradyrhizobium sp. CB82]|uniref:hypothetical protein n=1 Tax=Bradyrhizobium sp. CB82 TaxID=3039159 RepID=UPI0024B1C184|nr:hypothetical protein [Bradyrhizobium sp. CB82]WFU37749.1 hypothetical protein QA640_25140 [Bradyrhizobium sp. CB82]
MADWDRTGTGNASHNATQYAAELTRQIAIKNAAGSQSAVKAADVAFARSMLQSCRQNNIQPGVYVQMLVELGFGGA